MRTPPWLTEGVSVVVVAPSYTAPEADVRAGISVLKSWGLRVHVGRSVFETWGSFSGSDNQRLADLQAAISDSEAKAIICTRGGYGLNRILDQLDWERFKQNPKWVVGFSDVTALHLQIQKLGFASIHGPMVVHYGRPAHEKETGFTQKILFGLTEATSVEVAAHTLRIEEMHLAGTLIGGNLTMVTTGIGTSSSPFSEGKILLLEEIGESYYRIDRMLNHLQRAGLLHGLNAVVLGHFTDCAPNGFPLSIPEMVQQAVGEQVPVFTGMPSGHVAPNFPLVLGMEASLTKEGNGWQFRQRGGLFF